MMSGDAEDVVKSVVAAAKEGDMTAARLVLDRIAPLCRGRRVRLNLPPIVGAADLLRALAAMVEHLTSTAYYFTHSTRAGHGVP